MMSDVKSLSGMNIVFNLVGDDDFLTVLTASYRKLSSIALTWSKPSLIFKSRSFIINLYYSKLIFESDLNVSSVIEFHSFKSCLFRS